MLQHVNQNQLIILQQQLLLDSVEQVKTRSKTSTKEQQRKLPFMQLKQNRRGQPQWTNFDAVSLPVICLLLLLSDICSNVDAARYVGIGAAVNGRNGLLKEATHSSLPQGSDLFPALNEFSHHTVIRPEIHHGRNKRVIFSTLESEDGLHIPQITMSYLHDGRRVLIDLKRNDKLLPDEHFLRYQNSKTQTGHVVKRNFTKTELTLCHYQGSIRGKPESTVAVSTCHGGINGVVFDGTDTYFIHAGSDGQLHDEHYLLRHTDLLNQKNTCGYRGDEDLSDLHDHEEDLEAPWRTGTSAKNAAHNNYNKNDDDNNNNIDGNEFQRILRYKRSNADNNMIRGPYNANNHSSYVELVIVVDNKVYKAYGENTKKVHQHCKDLANIINALYVPLNIFVALVGVVIWNESNEIEFSSDGDVTLRNFLNYRRNKLVLQHPNDNAQLLTKESFNGGVVGKALKGPICTHVYSGGVSMEHSNIIAVVATTMAHEMGHNFGMEHDTPDCKCQDEKCIMSASSTSIVPVHWSSCSIDQLNIAFSRGMNYCLRNKPTKLFDSPQCGNGFVEPGEQCDCGLPQYCENTCCDPHTCMLHANASCATGECCDLSKCRPKAAGMECRGADNECDLPEYCTGESEYCPADVFKRDTESCDEKRAYCYQGTCRSHSNQCRILWGETGESSEHCYYKNVEGKRTGNCGLNRINNTYIPCERENVDCGLLHCRHLNERLEFGMESAAELSHSFINHAGIIVPCRTALVDLGLQSIDPGLAPNGAKCGRDKMCVNQKCRLVTQLRAEGMGKACPNNCSGYGSCNSRGNCHCDTGFSGPDCSLPGHGGSTDSGPATNPNGNAAFQRFLYIFFFAVLPLMAAFCFFMYYCRNHPFFVGGKFTENILKSTGKKQPAQRIHSAGGGNGGSGSAGSANGTLQKSTPSSTDDMNSALLKSPSDSGGDPSMGNGMFGKFKGFTLRPLNDTTSPTNMLHGTNVAYVQPTVQQDSITVPVRAAPPPPLKGDDIKLNGTLGRRILTLPAVHMQPKPALPPPNPGSQARRLISMPVLENSTVSMPMHPMGGRDHSPLRPAPTLPPQAQTLKPAPAPPVPLHSDPKLNIKRDGTIRRIASFLKKEDKQQQAQPKEKTYIDRDKLRQMEISAPIPVVGPQGESSNSDSETTPKEEETKNLVKRTQSMRSPTKKANIQSFGSMRQAANNGGRPKSSVTTQVSARPKSPPPRPPPLKKTNSTTSSGYQLPVGIKSSTTAEHAYDDCEFVDIPLAGISEHTSNSEGQNNDNIYSVIEEIPPAAQTLKRSDFVSVASSMGGAAAGGGEGDMGLLSEIVSEIEKRNGDSIYSGASSLTRQLSAKEEDIDVNDRSPTTTKPTPATASTIETTAKVAASGSTNNSVTSYLRPAPIHTPVARVAPTRSDISPTNAFSSFKPQFPSSANAAGSSNLTTAQQPSNTSRLAGGVARKKSFNKALTTTTTTTSASKAATNIGNSAPSATITKPKPLSAKPSFSSTTRKGLSATTSKTNGVGTPRAAPTVKTGNIASLTQRFEKGAGKTPPAERK